MVDVETRVAALLEAPLGCAFLLIGHASGLAPEAVAEPAISVRVAAAAAKELSVWRSDHDAIVEEVLHRGKQHMDLARAILEQPDAAWWFGPLDIERQLWLSRTGVPPTPAEFVAPSPPLSDWERYAQKSARGMYTSTLIGGTSSVLASVHQGAGDLDYQLPTPCWKLTAPASARILEVDGAPAWHDLCVRYAAQGRDGRLVPDWAAVAGRWDAVHLTFGGWLAADQVRVASTAGWSQHWGWDAEQTLWLRWMFTDSERLADCDRPSTAVHLVFPRADF